VKKIAFALLLGAAFVSGCGDKAADGKDAKSASAASSGEAKKDDKAGGGGEIGVKECDDYMAAYSKCLDKMPAEAKGPMKDAYDQQVKAWKEAAKGPGKDALATGCKAAADAMASNPACK
jgi:hypothetical protein